MKSLNKRLKFILIDGAGIILIILAGLTGWIPGPGGIPLLIAGLGMLSINHDWAKRWLVNVKESGVNLSDKLFNGSRTATIIVDIIGILFIALGVTIVLVLTGNIARTTAIWLIIVALVLLLGNRQRLKSLLKKR